jgi:hypothetical protein
MEVDQGGFVIAADQHFWRLSEGGDRNLGVAGTIDGLRLGRTPLVERCGNGFAVRPRDDLDLLLRRAYGAEIAIDRVVAGLRVVASALAEDNLCLAQIAALHLRRPDLADLAARGRVEHQDALIKRTRSDDVASRDWDPAKHPRADAPPNPGWFAPKGDGPAAPPPIQVAHAEEEERAPEELLDPVGPVRQAVWDARIALLRRIDPANPSLTYFANPGTPPGPAALGRLNAAIEAAAIKRVADKVMPNGVPIGRRGRGEDIRELPGGIRAAEDLFDFLRVAGTDYRSEPNLKIVKLLGQDAFITYRPVSTSGSPAIDVNIPGYPFIRFHFLGD